MNNLSYFERLEESVGLIVRHPYFPGKPAAVAQCAGEIDELVRIGRLTGEQGGRLLDLVRGVPGRKHALAGPGPDDL
jgi:hypothetical protein